jgi:hypothetical protein
MGPSTCAGCWSGSSDLGQSDGTVARNRDVDSYELPVFDQIATALPSSPSAWMEKRQF